MKRIDTHTVALITGSDRGIGYETANELGARGFRVIITSPDRKNGIRALKKLSGKGIDVVFHILDVLREDHIRDLRRYVIGKFGGLGVLVNNAGVLLDEGRSKLEGLVARRLTKKPKRVGVGEGPSVLDVNMEIVRCTLEVNTLGPLRMCQAFVPHMLNADYGRVINVSSSRGQLNGMGDDGAPAYQLSKAALNAVTLMVAGATKGGNVLVNSVCPDWTRTDIGGPEAPQSARDAAQSIVRLATLPNGGPTGKFFLHNEEIDW